MIGFGHFGGGSGFGFGFFGVSPFLIFFIVMMIVSAIRRSGYRGYRGGRNYPKQGPPYDVRPYQRGQYGQYGQYDPNNPNNPDNQPSGQNNPADPGAYPSYPTGQENQGEAPQGYSNEPTYGYPVAPAPPPAANPGSYSSYGYSGNQTMQPQVRPEAGAGTTRVDNLPTAGGEPTRPVPYDELPDEVKAYIPRPQDAKSDTQQ